MFGVIVPIVCVVRVRKNWSVGTIDTQSPKSCVCVCVCARGGVGGWWSETSVSPMPPPPQSRGNTAPYLPTIYGKPFTWWPEFSLELTFEAQSSFKFLEVLDLVFACICNEKRLKSNNILEYLCHLCAIF